MKNQCIDAGREGCPCALAEHGKCLVCSKLNGGDCQDCGWQGSCIYTLYAQSGHKIVQGRQGKLLDIVEIKNYGPDLKVFVVQADKGFCQKAQTVGAYVFVRGQNAEQWYEAPISVLKAEPEKALLHLGICRCGPKTGEVFAETEKLWVRGVYYNALSGLSTLRENPEAAMVYAKGIAIAPFRNFLDGGSRYTKWLSHLHLYVDLDKVGPDFFRDYFGDLPAEAIEVREFAKEGISSLDDLDRMEEMKGTNILALTSPYYAAQVERARGSAIVRPTEGNLCCGEGVCGACTYVDDLGRTVRRCKLYR